MWMFGSRARVVQVHEPRGVLFRFAVGTILTAVALRVIWIELQPMLPWLAACACLVTLWRVIGWWRDRW
jgi:hypothetical protein